MAAQPLAAQDQPSTGDWQAICDDQGCRLAQSLVLAQSETTVLMARVFDSATPTLVLTVPLGSFLKPGLLMAIDDGAPRAFAFEICDEFGCHAGVPLDDGLLRDLKRGLKAEIAFVDGTQEQVSLSLSLVGFTNGMQRLTEARSE
ncbi:invasion associated locus B family protein [uncultured Tateyamaria sp.]|uniref:invasion associated locus B family protein n=1 Tax=uncultured Tateyamaria sp. TaxID=455651 RepID=UPI002624465E|nr:invasion associated locus B family protein [uncultured Tateyamaria sp.]